MIKVAQIFADFLVYFENHHFLVKTAFATFWPILAAIGPLFSPTSGHIDHIHSDPIKALFAFCILLFRVTWSEMQNVQKIFFNGATSFGPLTTY